MSACVALPSAVLKSGRFEDSCIRAEVPLCYGWGGRLLAVARSGVGVVVSGRW